MPESRLLGEGNKNIPWNLILMSRNVVRVTHRNQLSILMEIVEDRPCCKGMLCALNVATEGAARLSSGGAFQIVQSDRMKC